MENRYLQSIFTLTSGQGITLIKRYVSEGSWDKVTWISWISVDVSGIHCKTLGKPRLSLWEWGATQRAVVESVPNNRSKYRDLSDVCNDSAFLNLE